MNERIKKKLIKCIIDHKKGMPANVFASAIRFVNALKNHSEWIYDYFYKYLLSLDKKKKSKFLSLEEFSGEGIEVRDNRWCGKSIYIVLQYDFERMKEYLLDKLYKSKRYNPQGYSKDELKNRLKDSDYLDLIKLGINRGIGDKAWYDISKKIREKYNILKAEEGEVAISDARGKDFAFFCEVEEIDKEKIKIRIRIDFEEIFKYRESIKYDKEHIAEIIDLFLETIDKLPYEELCKNFEMWFIWDEYIKEEEKILTFIKKVLNYREEEEIEKIKNKFPKENVFYFIRNGIGTKEDLRNIIFDIIQEVKKEETELINYLELIPSHKFE